MVAVKSSSTKQQLLSKTEIASREAGLDSLAQFYAIGVVTLAVEYPELMPIQWHQKALDITGNSVASSDLSSLYHGMQLGAHVAKEHLGVQNV